MLDSISKCIIPRILGEEPLYRKIEEMVQIWAIISNVFIKAGMLS